MEAGESQEYVTVQVRDKGVKMAGSDSDIKETC